MAQVRLQDLSRRLADLLNTERDYEAGFALGRHILRYYPKHLSTYVDLGKAALAVGLHADAHDLLRRALSIDPEDAELWLGLHDAATALGEAAEAEAAAAMAAQLQPTDNPPTLVSQAVKAAQASDWKQAQALFTQARSAAPDRMDITLALATAQWQMRDIEGCRAVAESVLQSLPNALKAHLLLAHCAHRRSDANAMWTHVRAARTLDPLDSYHAQWFSDLAMPVRLTQAMLPAWNETERWSFLRPVAALPA